MLDHLLAVLLAVVVALGAGGTFWGYRTGKKNAEAKQTKANLKASKDAKDNRYELETSDDQHLVNILTGKLRK